MGDKQIAVFGGGCFWCTEAVFKMLRGISVVKPGYAGGMVLNPTYEQVCSGTTGHAEVIWIEYDPREISYRDLLTVFFGSKTAPKLYQELHGEGKKPVMTIDAILEWATDPQLRFVDKKVWDLINFGRPQHASPANQTLLIEEDGVSVRKTILKKSK